ncbi:hypothetical protein ARMSODRAFT_1023789 [Armillaria solidipes]|uniref:Retrotransposon gag domain-containing protein n=1 Tax=Armillaria solidipes TaxID=1076256 RepID=A0A2H3BG86_9AGAR|nr:hypothetical protein ARMSODRAFT_1023789 [Armillaria solidipes]
MPQPPPRWRAPDKLPQLTGDADNDAPWLGIKPTMLRPPLPFEGKYNDIERFVGDCFTYFEAFSPFFQPHFQKVAFATSYFEGLAKDWWEFVGLLTTQFHDPTIEEVHEKRMFDLWMGKGPAVTYFQKLEIEVKKAGRWGDDQARGLMVKAIRLGVPDSYTNTITNSGQNIPSSYNDWRRCILIMYKERQKKWVFDQTAGISQNPAPSPQRATAILPPATTKQVARQSINDDENDSDLHPRDDGCDAGDAAATTGRSSRRESRGGDPASQGTTRALKSKQPSPPSLGPVQETLKGPSQLPARAQAKAAEPAGHRVESPKKTKDDNTSTLNVMATEHPTRAIPGPEMGIKNGPPTLKGTGKTGNTAFAAQVEPDMLPTSGPSMRCATHCSILILKQQDEEAEEAALAANILYQRQSIDWPADKSRQSID